MLKIVVLASGSGTNLQAMIDSIEKGEIWNTEIAMVISNNEKAYALDRARNCGIPAVCISPKDYPSREEFYKKLLFTIEEVSPELIVLAGFLVFIPEIMIKKYIL